MQKESQEKKEIQSGQEILKTIPFWKTWVQDNHTCNKECSGENYHTSCTGISNDRIFMIIHLENRIQFEGAYRFTHLTVYSKFFEDNFFCFGCSLFNPRILYYEIRERFREWKETI